MLFITYEIKSKHRADFPPPGIGVHFHRAKPGRLVFHFAPAELGSFLWKELPDRAEDRPLRSKGAAVRRIFTNMPHQAPAGPRIFYENPLSSVAYGDTPGRALRCSLCVQAMLTY